ncbi:MAG: tRNA dihydrouridine(20/20a) synthase DusA [Pseudomonadales bacterium]|nr:tRNA dihydrouridine(20/20a) synthase DusA [Pseudomonadales bacterium]
MMDWTDRHDRVFLRQFSRHALLYTEMVTSAALRHGDASYLLQYDPSEHPVALQLGGSDPEELSEAAVMGARAGFDEINLNVGCPSDRVQSGAFGACLMASPELVKRCVSAMKSAVDLEVTVKCRIGIDEQDSEEFLMEFVEQINSGGCNTIIIHARKAILQGLSPKENREIPPLNYDRVRRVKQLFPEMNVVINGGITSLNQALELLRDLDGVMLGREAYQNPYILHAVDEKIFGATATAKSRMDYLNEYLPYVARELDKGTPLKHMSRHLLGLFKGQKGGKQFRRHLSENSHRKDAGLSVLKDALAHVM